MRRGLILAVLIGLAVFVAFGCAPTVDELTGLPPISQHRSAVPPPQGSPPPPGTYQPPARYQPPRGTYQPPVTASVPGRILADTTVNVAPRGGGANLQFSVFPAGRRVRILLQALSPGMMPYGHLSHPQGERYFPTVNSARGGVNDGTTILPYQGQYTLTVFDSTNRGGQVRVRVVQLSR